ncbi:MAG: cadherin repeat domain-containing protein, partial [Gammaproteobacteria bacterium]|nr:cadherin repeat domain-containing protein [Gammaproteobacteria bacterium]
ITAGNSQGIFSINSATGQITIADNTRLDYETTTAYALTVQVQDNGTGTLSDTASITINVNNIADSIPVSDGMG